MRSKADEMGSLSSARHRNQKIREKTRSSEEMVQAIVRESSLGEEVKLRGQDL